jgi:superfamily II DNA or RNA helicase
MPAPIAPLEITERLLSDAGGWQALKEGKGLWEAGKVEGATYQPPFLRGAVKDGVKEYRAGLRLVTRTNIENLCSCRLSRERGMVCAHSMAVGIAYLKAAAEPVNKSVNNPVNNMVNNSVDNRLHHSPGQGIAPGDMSADSGPTFDIQNGSEAIIHVVIAPAFTSGWEKDSVTFQIEIETDGRRILAQAINPTGLYRVSPEDLRAIEAIRAVSAGDLPGIMTLDRQKCHIVLQALRGHPRVTLGRAKPISADELLAMLPAAANDPNSAIRIPQSALPPPRGLPRFLLLVEGSLNHLAARLQAQYGDRTVRAGDPEAFRYRGESGAWRTRNPEAECTAIERLHAFGFSAPDRSGEMILKGERPILRFLAEGLPGLEKDWKVELGARFTNINETIARVRPRVEVRGSGADWFDLSVELETPDGGTFSAAEIQRLLRMGQNHVRMKNGSIALFDTQMLDELGQALADCDPAQSRPGAYRIRRAHAGYLAGVLGEGVSLEGPAEWRQWTSQQLKPDALAPVPLGPLEEILRPYQKHGVYWLSFLARNGFGGILADEMGLGKTLQALAFLQGLPGGVSLIVCPSSLVQNWAREAAKFTPGLRVVTLEGAERHTRMAALAEADLAITSYPLLRRDAARYAGIDFQAIILDEAQHIKNPETQNAQAAASLKGQHRIVLTGTPLENSVRDLWSIMNFAMPGYLGSRDDFKERYEQPIVQGADSAPVKSRLAKRIRPFLLRRTKREVYKELPEKLEQVVYCSLTVQQTEVYEKLLRESRRQISDLSGKKDQNKSRMLMLTALLRLRQACCDLRLLGMNELPQDQASAKLELLDELRREAIDGGHRVLIFSQFVAMLQLQKAALDAGEIPYCYLDGQTKDRMQVVDRFQDDPAIPVFLISLKAGGVGLNLTAADTVVHFDPWWNPAVEAQATDRAHRIGQEKVVTAYKLIARGTVEEKILKLQQSKRGLMESIESEEPVMAGLTTAEIQELLG